MSEKEEFFSMSCDVCKGPSPSIRFQDGVYRCVDCFVKQSVRKDVAIVYISVSGGVISVDKKSKGVKVIIREYDEEKELGLGKPYLITYPEDKEIECSYDFFKAD